jgi:hypothetical protein
MVMAHDAVALEVADRVLLAAHAALDDRGDGLEVAGVEGQGEVHLVAVRRVVYWRK